MKRILLSLITIGITSSLAFGLTGAYFSDTETSEENTFVAGAIDLMLNGDDNTDSIVYFDDLKPGDDYIEEKILRVDTNPAYVWFHIFGLDSNQGTQTEPEEVEEAENEPKWDIENYLTYDLSIFRDGENEEVLVDYEDGNLLPEMVSCWIPLGELPGNTDVVVNQSFHFDPEVTNWAQGDTLTFTEEFYAVQSRNNPNPQPPESQTGRYWDPLAKHCVDCEEGPTWASNVVSSDQGQKKSGADVNENRSDPENALGEPDTVSVNGPKWFSLGFGGEIVVRFAFPVLDIDGVDLSFHEITGGRANYPEETADVYVSQNGVDFEYVGEVSSEPGGGGDGVVYLDFNSTGFDSIQYVKIIDTTNPDDHNNNADGYDLDAVDATYGTCSPGDEPIPNQDFIGPVI